MTTPADRGFGRPDEKGYEARNIITSTIGPFPKKGKLTRLHPVVTLRVHRAIEFLLRMAITEVIVTTGYRFDGAVLDDWGFCYRPIRGYETKWRLTRLLRYLSNHSWGLAVDLNAQANPMTNDGRNHTDMPPAVVAIFRKWGFEWGGDYTGKRKDPMHFEWSGTKQMAEQRTRDVKAFLGIKAA